MAASVRPAEALVAAVALEPVVGTSLVDLASGETTVTATDGPDWFLVDYDRLPTSYREIVGFDLTEDRIVAANAPPMPDLSAGEGDMQIDSYYLLSGPEGHFDLRLIKEYKWEEDPYIALGVGTPEGGFVSKLTSVFASSATGFFEGNVTLIPGDVLFGTAGADTLVGTASDDFLAGFGGADRLDGRAGDDTLFGGAGDDVLVGGLGRDLMDGGAGDDRFYSYVDQGPDTILGGAGTDLAVISRARATTSFVFDLAGGAFTSFADGSAFGGLERISFRAGLAADTLTGGALDDTLAGNGGDDRLAGAGGADSLEGGGGADVLSGGAGDDTLSGGSGYDTLRGDAGNDVLSDGDEAGVMFGGIGNDLLFGGGGDDALIGGAGADVMEGGAGSDTFYVDSMLDRVSDSGGAIDQVIASVSFTLGEGLEWLTIEADVDVARSGTGNDGGNRLIGHHGADVLRGMGGGDYVLGWDGDDRIFGGDGDDTIWAGEGNDTLYGDAGDDFLEGGRGADLFRGGTGSDAFVFMNAEEIGAGRDLILDFAKGADVIDLSSMVYGSLAFVGSDAFDGKAGEIRVDRDEAARETLVLGDLDGDAVADFTLRLSGTIALDASDFAL